MSAAWPPPPDDATSGWPSAPAPAGPALTCYRHPRAEAPVACNRCDRPICTDCMVSAPVGWQCPSCVKGGPPVRSMRDVRPGGSLVGDRPYVTLGLIGASALGFVLEMTDASIQYRYGISALGVAAGHLEQIVTAGFLHVGLLHIAFNMLLLYQLGSALEARIGRLRFAGLYAAGLLGGAIGELLLSPPDQHAVGASGAVFGLMAAVFVLPRRSRYGIEGSVGGLLVLNLAITFFVPGIAIGGHIGGLIAGAAVGGVYRLLGEPADQARAIGGAAFAFLLAAVLALAASPAADWAIQHRVA